MKLCEKRSLAPLLAVVCLCMVDVVAAPEVIGADQRRLVQQPDPVVQLRALVRDSFDTLFEEVGSAASTLHRDAGRLLNRHLPAPQQGFNAMATSIDNMHRAGAELRRINARQRQQ
ncbi:hypothetical protein [Pseudomonas sp. NW5]|uniref:hypothetical protein n=1 Tax=Pseudomonas sp. NW5 TaxID=2934934 RepID=UPI002020028A|nr:hypothetical protein [Pseudomonas sp. NW5]MCL7462994.1 hypothetical protein [Pseudomonas sp. NW5]